MPFGDQSFNSVTEGGAVVDNAGVIAGRAVVGSDELPAKGAEGPVGGVDVTEGGARGTVGAARMAAGGAEGIEGMAEVAAGGAESGGAEPDGSQFEWAKTRWITVYSPLALLAAHPIAMEKLFMATAVQVRSATHYVIGVSAADPGTGTHAREAKLRACLCQGLFSGCRQNASEYDLEFPGQMPIGHGKRWAFEKEDETLREVKQPSPLWLHDNASPSRYSPAGPIVLHPCYFRHVPCLPPFEKEEETLREVGQTLAFPVVAPLA
jgi:hypothetical protein